MSRIANNPVTLPAGVELTVVDQRVAVKGSKGTLEMALHSQVGVNVDANVVTFSALSSSKASRAMSGTVRSLVSNMVHGVSEGFERKLVLNGVGYRAKATGSTINLTLGFSHPVDYELPAGVTVETPSQTEIVLKGIDKQQVGQVAAEIRAFRPPEPYKGKGVRYADEQVRRKEAKKK